ncbi:hypothetical protein BG015_005879 [Linnemannia schmuckeri]|uniref:ADP-ribosylation factor n=1 Tax=Linnemannia schmuckeri TaxID=64567 RepID=A0A9P5S3X0_9FUNG|nr:hypothetical protein BG015_005879 [Linnemannia schmuckeri]
MRAATSLSLPLSQQRCLATSNPPYYFMMRLSGSGKTAILYRLYMSLYITSTPSLSENLETIEYDHNDRHVKRMFNLLDFIEGGGRALRKHETWRTDSRQNLQGVIFVVDSADHNPLSIELASERLAAVLQEEVEDSNLLPLLVLANKQDCPHPMSVADVRDLLGLEGLPSEQVWHIQGVSANLDEGLRDEFD